MSEMIHNGSSQGAWRLTPDSHDEFLELCALATTGELTAEEWERLNEHLAQCDSCLRASQEFEQVVATTIPALASESVPEEGVENLPKIWSIEQAERTLMESLNTEPSTPKAKSSAEPGSAPLRLSPLLAIAAMVLAACSLAAYQIGIHYGRTTDAAAARAGSQTANPVSHPHQSEITVPPANGKNGKPEDEKSALSKEQAAMNQLELTKLEQRQSQLEDELAKQSNELSQSVQDRAELNRQLTLAQANAESLEARLRQIDNQKSQEAEQSLAIKSQVNDLTVALQEKDREIAQEQELLQHDRDIRNLIGARNLYMAEIYDVAKTGDTQRPFGRVFYTKDKSLIFYGYDLDQQHGLKKAHAFQAWGRGVDQHRDVSLGLLYQDDASQERWVLKFNNAKTISQIDAVFVTVEPEGGSSKPSGKPLLFTSLRIEPNHP
jgi:anti-sigma factor RsiW